MLGIYLRPPLSTTISLQVKAYDLDIAVLVRVIFVSASFVSGIFVDVRCFDLDLAAASSI